MTEQPLRRPAVRASLTLALCGIAAGAASIRAQTAPVQDLATFPRATVEIHGRSSSRRFEVWVADTEDRKEQGLMFVRDLPANEGMLFVDCCSGIWMKNTYIALDIVFVGPDGRIFKIAADARPFDETTIPAGQPVKAVIELKGGEAARDAIKVGDRVQWHAVTAAPAKGAG